MLIEKKKKREGGEVAFKPACKSGNHIECKNREQNQVWQKLRIRDIINTYKENEADQNAFNKKGTTRNSNSKI